MFKFDLNIKNMNENLYSKVRKMMEMVKVVDIQRVDF